jgi:hypothetical protein
MMDTANNAGLDFQVYLSPMSGVYLESLKELGEFENFLSWRERVAAVASEKNVPFKDFTTGTVFSKEEVIGGSTEWWIDASHFKPVVGEWILGELADTAKANN